jgi:hypothetical protein
MSRLPRVLLLALALSLVLSPVALAATYDVTTDRSVDVPDRTIEQGGQSFEVTAISRADPGETVSVTATAPQNESVRLYLYNDRQAIVTAREGTGTSRFTVSLGGYEAGTYAFVLQHDGVREAVHPLVVRGYETSVDAPGSVTRGETVTVTAGAEKLRGPDLASVEVVVANDREEVRATATPGSNGYTATVDTDDLSVGSYEVYATVRGPNRAFGEREILGFTAGQPLTVESADATPTEAPAGGGAVGGGATATPDATATPSATPGATASPPADGVTAPLADARPDRPGVTVVVDAPTLAAITYADDSVAGTGAVTVTTQTSAPDAFTGQFDPADVLTSVTVDAPAAARESRARLQFGLPASALGDRPADSLVVVRAAEGGLQLLPTEVNASGSTVAVAADTSGGTQFAVVSVERTDAGGDEQTATPTATDGGVVTPDTATPGTPTEGDGSTHLVPVAAAAALLTALVLRRRR